ncbi:MAG: hypothetical protein Q8N81_00045, partial [bacterium]|nr:hypothetical protein [bacterium]
MRTVIYVMSIMLVCTLLAMSAGCACCPKNEVVEECPTTQPVCETPIEEDFCPPRKPLVQQMDRMTHNSELADMSIADLHFVPNR